MTLPHTSSQVPVWTIRVIFLCPHVEHCAGWLDSLLAGDLTLEGCHQGSLLGSAPAAVHSCLAEDSGPGLTYCEWLARAQEGQLRAQPSQRARHHGWRAARPSQHHSRQPTASCSWLYLAPYCQGQQDAGAPQAKEPYVA